MRISNLLLVLASTFALTSASPTHHARNPDVEEAVARGGPDWKRGSPDWRRGGPDWRREPEAAPTPPSWKRGGAPAW
ncbi:hypothetical protein Hypma_013888 [Hypsizygus marmoreus]|uniref:Uncharacterized protein n=1 Tax=Hypsizygus marmoreus TaxID=39966 RepID=A0A369KGL3_HYPMA|nr:hypothetical protein Hypma_013888 [Hypsizygus marmoreus]